MPAALCAWGVLITMHLDRLCSRVLPLALAATVILSLIPGSLSVYAASGLLAAYPFDATSGTSATDVSGNNLSGTLHNASWTTGKYANALAFNGSSSYVDLGNPSSFKLTSSATWSAWVFASANPADDGLIIAKSRGASGWQFKTSPDTGQHRFALGLTTPSNTWVQRNSNTVRALNTWYYVAAVYNASARTLDLYVNGVLDNGPLTTDSAGPVPAIPASQLNNTSANVNIGRRSDAGYYFNGTVDEVRVYNRALSATEIQTDMNTPLGAPDTQVPTAPGTPVPSVVSSSQINLSWPAATDNVGVTGYLLERCQGAGCSTFTQIATPASASFNDTGLSPATSYSYRVRATDAAANLSPYSTVASATTSAASDTQAPTAPGTPVPSVIGSSQINLSWPAATDNVGVTGYLLERCQGANCSTFTQIATPASASFNDTGLSPATSYSYRVRATDAAANLSPYSTVASATTSTSGPSLLVAYPFDATSGTSATDVSGNNLSGTLHNASWTTGKYANALAFNGSSSYVDLGNPSSFQLTSSATWSAWVFASANPADDGLIIAKSRGASGWQFKTSPDTGQHRFALGLTTPSNTWVQRNSNTVRALNTWYYVAAVYNASARTLDLYVNGVLDNGPLTTDSAGPVPAIPASQLNNTSANVNIGRRSDAGYYFNGTVDEVRVYNRALSATEIQTDMNTPLGAPDTQVPTAPGTPVPSVASSSQINLSWPASD